MCSESENLGCFACFILKVHGNTKDSIPAGGRSNGCLQGLGYLRSLSHNRHPRKFVVPTPIIVSFTSPSFLTYSYRFRCAWDGQPVPNCCWISHTVVFVVIDRKGDQSIPVRGMRMCHPALWTVSDTGFYRQSFVAICLVDCNSTNILSGLRATQGCAAWTSLQVF